MICSHSYSNGFLEFVFIRDPADEENISSLNYDMTNEKIFFKLPSQIKEIHPDLIALTAILLVNPFVSEKLQLPVPVSNEFFRRVSKVISRYEIVEMIDHEIKPIIRNEANKPALAFSGGADSSAALAVMPASTVPVFLNRPIVRGNKYNSEAPLKICDLLNSSGYDVYIVDSNLEFIRRPVGFPTDLANAIPAILLSDYLDIDSVAFGTVLESGYGIGHETYNDYGKGSHWGFFSEIFGAAGLDLFLPTLGISEVGTSIIGGVSPIASVGQSCIRGKWKRPCMKCWKCFRKELLSFSLNSSHKGYQTIREMLRVPEVQIKLSSFPISHENVITYSIQRLDISDSEELRIISNKLKMDGKLDFLEKWYPKSIDFVPDKYRSHVRSKILDYLEPTNYEDEVLIENWDMNPHLSSTKAIRAQDNLVSFWQDLG